MSEGATGDVILPGPSIAPSEVLTVFFDGGAKPRWNDEPALVYGSFKVMEWKNEEVQRHEYTGYRTSNEAEFLTATQALRFLVIRHPSPASLQVRLHGDSMLTVNCLSGLWKLKNGRLKAIAGQFAELRTHFHSVTLSWHRRAWSVAVLGH